MKLKELLDEVHYDGILIGIYGIGNTYAPELIEEFYGNDKEKCEKYQNETINGVWILNEDTLCTNIYI